MSEALAGGDPPLVVDIDGTLTDDDRAVDPRVFPVLREWDAPVVIATGKAVPYPVALCEFLRIPHRVVAENGGVAYAHGMDHVELVGDRAAAEAVRAALVEREFDVTWGDVDLVNRWRETELALPTELPLDAVRDVAATHGLRVFDTGFAYHVTSPEVDKASGLVVVADALDLAPGDFLAVGDSENDAALFAVAGHAVAVANADDAAKDAADAVTDAAYADGFLEAVDRDAPFDSDW
jgi:phosphoglycolate phosphatase (TIGR01487 family)